VSICPTRRRARRPDGQSAAARSRSRRLVLSGRELPDDRQFYGRSNEFPVWFGCSCHFIKHQPCASGCQKYGPAFARSRGTAAWQRSDDGGQKSEVKVGLLEIDRKR